MMGLSKRCKLILLDINTIHLHKSRLEEKTNILLLLVPGLIFILTLGLFLLTLNRQTGEQIAAGEDSYVLSEKDSLDNTSIPNAK